MEDCLSNEKLANAVQELKVLLSSKNELGDKALKIPQVEECDFESDLELAFFVVGWKYDLGKAFETICNSRKLRQSSKKLKVARRNVRAGKIKGIEDFPHRKIVNQYWEHDQTHTNIYTEDGMPVAICRVGEVDLYGLQESLPIDDFQEYMVYVFEYRLFVLENIMKGRSDDMSLPRYVDIHCLNCPRGFLSTFSYSNIQYFRWWMGTLGPAYPEQCSHVILVNTPWLFYGGWNLTKSWLPARTVDKIEILGSDIETWKAGELVTKIGRNCVDACIEYLARLKPSAQDESNKDGKTAGSPPMSIEAPIGEPT